MSLDLEFESHSWYMGWGIKHDTSEVIGRDDEDKRELYYTDKGYIWSAYTANGMTGFVEELHANTLKELKQKIKQHTLTERKRVERLYR